MTLNKFKKGFSLIELMISMTLGMLLITAVISIFLTSNKNFNQNDRYARLQENGRFAMRQISKELTMANFWGGMTEPGDIDTTIPIGAQCNLQLDTSNGFLIANNVDAATASSLSGACISSATFQPFTDLIVIKHAAGKGILPANAALEMKPNTPYVITNGSSGRLRVTGSSPDAKPTGNERAYQYIIRIYYIRDNDDGVSSLYRYSLPSNGGINLVEEQVVDGIENIQIQFGIDTDDDQAANMYVSNPTPAELSNAMTARVSVLARGVREVTAGEDDTYDDQKLYFMGEDVPYSPNAANFPPKDKTNSNKLNRRMFTNTVMLRNIANLAAIR